MERKFAVETPGTAIKHAHYFESPAKAPTVAERKGYDVKCHMLTGVWRKVVDEAARIFEHDEVELGWQNGFHARTKCNGLPVFVITTGTRKGIWYKVG